MKTVISSKAQVIDCKYITIHDFSVYNPDVEVTNALYRITLAAFNQYVDVPYTPNTVMNINSNLLNLTGAYYSGLCDIPSGLFVINQSVCPNDKLFSEYYLFNICPDLEKLKNAVCCWKEDKEKLDLLWDIKMELELAKTLAEDCNDTKKAIALYNTASKRLNQLGCEC